MKKQETYESEKLDFSNLKNFQSIDVEGDWNQVKERVTFRKSRKTLNIWQVAAIIALIISVGYLTTQYINNPPELIFATTGEEQKEVVLPDGSQVHLNKNSKLTYPEKFSRKRREVSLSGEGFFKIMKDPGKKFSVHMSDRATVEVLGTSFNIKAPPNSLETKVQVVEGKVAFYISDEQEVRTILNKGDQAEISQGQILINSNRNPNFLSWRTGILVFNQSPIAEVADQLAKYYNKKIILDENIPDDTSFTSTIDNQELEDVLEEMSLVLNLKITYNPDNILISKLH